MRSASCVAILQSTSIEEGFVLDVPDAPSYFRNTDSLALRCQHERDKILKIGRRLAMGGKNGPSENQLQQLFVVHIFERQLPYHLQ